jgi:predicted ArsR family transcriptional regulator
MMYLRNRTDACLTQRVIGELKRGGDSTVLELASILNARSDAVRKALNNLKTQGHVGVRERKKRAVYHFVREPKIGRPKGKAGRPKYAETALVLKASGVIAPSAYHRGSRWGCSI